MAITFTWTIEPAVTPPPPATDSTASPGSDDGESGFRDWALDPADGFIQSSPDDGDAVFNTGAAGIASDIQDKLKAWLGEWYLDTSLGFPWLQDVLGQRYDAALVRRDIQAVVLSSPGATGMQNYAAQFDNVGRVLSVAFQIVCDFGALINATLTVTQGA